MLFNTRSQEGLLSVPNEDSGSQVDTPAGNRSAFDRIVSVYENCSQRFNVQELDFSKQYSHIYSTRLSAMTELLIGRARNKWGKDIRIVKLHEQFGNSTVIIIGTLFKNMKLQASILKDISEENNLPPQPPQSCFCSDDDKLILEDETQRILLVGNIDVHAFVTGVVIAVRGRGNEGGKFHVDEYCFADPREYVKLDLEKRLTPNDRWILLVSGFGFGNNASCMFNIQMFIDSIIGLLGEEGEQNSMSRICRVIIAGNSLSQKTQDKDFTAKAKYLTKNIHAGSVEAMQSLDDMLEQLVTSVEVDIMPGEFDPANHILPQQPFHRCMLPKASKYTTLHGVTNPYEALIDNIRVLGTSGQNIDDICRYSHLDNRLDIMEKTLLWGHIAPTAPDTLGSFPFYKQDPFIIGKCPHIYFAGNQPEFATKLLEGPSNQMVRVISLPSFVETSTCVLVNLDTLDCQLLNINGKI